MSTTWWASSWSACSRHSAAIEADAAAPKTVPVLIPSLPSTRLTHKDHYDPPPTAVPAGSGGGGGGCWGVERKVSSRGVIQKPPYAGKLFCEPRATLVAASRSVVGDALAFPAQFLVKFVHLLAQHVTILVTRRGP